MPLIMSHECVDHCVSLVGSREYVSQQHPAKTLPINITTTSYYPSSSSTASAAVNHTDKNKGRPDGPQPHQYNHVDANSASPAAAGMFGRCFHASAKNSILDESALF